MIKRLFLYALLLNYGCAQIKPLSGGEKDTIPPNIIQTNPKNLELNVKSKEFYFVFDEIIDGSKLKEKLIISPFYEGSFESIVKKNTLLLSFDSAFEKETTYIFSFADGISDITEGNPSIYSKYIFSTGNRIDSSSVSGVVYDPIENKFIEGAVVGLYHREDSFDLFSKKPIYFAFSDVDGHFKIENIKEGSYTIYAFQDENKNFVAEYKTEKFGFKSLPINVVGKSERIPIFIYNEDLTELGLQRVRKKDSVFEVVYNKSIKSYTLGNKKLQNSLYDNKTISFFKTFEVDSVLMEIKTVDKTNKNSLDSVYVMFNNETKAKINIKSSFNVSSQNIDDTVLYYIETNVPLTNYQYQSNFYVDTILIPNNYYIDKNKKTNNNLIEGKLFMFVDSVINFIERKKENIINDSLLFDNDSIFKTTLSYYKNLNLKKLTYKIGKDQLLTITGDTLKDINQTFNVRESEYYGSLKGSISKKINEGNYIIELVSDNLSLILKNETSSPRFEFYNIIPGKYFIRIYDDTNNNKEWDYYSITTKKESEKIYFFQDLIDIRSNWSVDDVVLDVDLLVDNMFLKDSTSTDK